MERRPVIVWIHGGGLVGGMSSEKVADGTNLAREGAVVVTIAYRLGALGFIAHPDLTRENGKTHPAIHPQLRCPRRPERAWSAAMGRVRGNDTARNGVRPGVSLRRVAESRGAAGIDTVFEVLRGHVGR
jgi:hypothetical protein